MRKIFLFCLLISSVDCIAGMKPVGQDSETQKWLKQHISEAAISVKYAEEYRFADILDHDSLVNIAAFDEDGIHRIFKIATNRCFVYIYVNLKTQQVDLALNTVCN